MKNLFAKFLSLSLKMKIITVAVPSILVIGAVATPIIINANKEPIEAPIDVAEATVEPTIESTEESTEEPTVEPTEESTVEPTEESTEEPTTETTIASTEELTIEPTEEAVDTPTTDPVSQESPQSPKEPTPNTSNANYDLPYIVNGRDIRGGDIDGDGVTDNHGNTWYQGKIFVGSNGVKVRIADAYDVNATIGHPDAIFRDGTENIEPGSDWLYAVNEYLGTVDLHSIDASSLPSVNTVSSKQTTINRNDASFVAYKAAFDPLWSIQNVGHDGGFSALQTIDKNHDGQTDGIGLLSALGVTGYMWEMRYDSDNGYWKLEIKGNYTELIWNSIHNSIRMITPDADAVYNAIYELYYYGGDWVADYDGWYPIPNANSEILVHLEGNSIYYCFR